MQSALDYIILRQKHVIFRYKACQVGSRSSVHIPLQVKTADRNHISAHFLETLSSRVDSRLVRVVEDYSFSTATLSPICMIFDSLQLSSRGIWNPLLASRPTGPLY